MRNLFCVLLILALSICAFAGNGKISLMSPGTVNGTQLQAGDYKLGWNAEGDNVQLSIAGNGVKMTVPASIAPSSVKLQDSVVKATDGTIQEIHLGGKNLILKFSSAAAENKGQ